MIYVCMWMLFVFSRDDQREGERERVRVCQSEKRIYGSTRSNQIELLFFTQTHSRVCINNGPCRELGREKRMNEWMGG